ncbi:MAG: type IV secretion system DNA-binding domain-containing protein [Candidatus Spechtbacterales bacterium]|nr:type IV secretion system DNA-binding domain-containing protein [Candidatus Spechtbacterales bacterium]
MEFINYFAQLNYRGRDDKFGIKLDDRRRHMYTIGKTGMGKTNMIRNMAIQDILNGNGLGVIDPHGEFAEELLDFIPKERLDDVVYFNPVDYERPVGLNLLEDVGYNQRHLVASGLMGVFKKIWVDVWSARMEYILNNTILALLEYPNATLLDVNRMMANKKFRKEVLSYVEDPVVRAFWVEEFAQYSSRLAAEATASIQNKIGQFTTAPLIRNIVGQQKSTIDLREIMDEGKIFILNLSKGRIGEDNSRLLGAMTITKLFLAAMSRIDTPESQRPDFFLYVDEFQNFATGAFQGILSEARKYHLSLILAHQYIAQMEEEIRDAVFGNIGTLVTFRVGAEDAEFIEKEFSPAFSMEDLVNLPKYNIALKLMIDGVTSSAFSATTLPPMDPPHKESYKEQAIEKSRDTYGISHKEIEKVIDQWDTSSPRAVAKKGKEVKKKQPKAISLDEAKKNFPPPKSNKKKKISSTSSNKKKKSSSNTKSKKKKKKKSNSKGPDIEGLREILGNIDHNDNN